MKRVANTARALPAGGVVPGLLSLIPLAAGSAGAAARPVVTPHAARLANLIVISLAAFLLLLDGYFLLLAVSV
jgi:hypothetical protein